MTASSEYVLKTLESEFGYYRSQLQQTTMLGVYAAMLGLVSAYTTPTVFSRTLQAFTNYPHNSIPEICRGACSFYWIGLLIAWGATLVLCFPVSERWRGDRDDFTLDGLVRQVEQSERRRLPQTVSLAICPSEVQELVAEIVRIEVANKLAERVPPLRKRWRNRLALQSLVPYGISICLAGYVTLMAFFPS